MTISEIITKLIQFNKTERPLFVKIYTRDNEGNVIKTMKYPVDNAFSHADSYAEIIAEEAQGFLDT